MLNLSASILRNVDEHLPPALLRAIADKLIPGIPEQTRVAILQQTSLSDTNTDELPAAGAPGSEDRPTVLEDVIDKATAKSELELEINCKCSKVPVCDWREQV